MATGLAQYGFDNGIDTEFGKLACLWLIQALVTYFTSNNRLPNENS